MKDSVPDSVRLGVLSDTHGHADTCRAAIALLTQQGATHLVHCGDIGDGAAGVAVLDALAGTGCRFVWGNCDFDQKQLAPYARDLGLEVLADFGRFELAGRTIVVAHGDDPRRLRQLQSDAIANRIDFDLLLTGHTHAPHDERLGTARWVNPGALHRARPKTVATIDLADLDSKEALVIHEVQADES